MNQYPVFDIEKVKADYLEARCTPFNAVKDRQRFVAKLSEFRHYLILEIGEESVQELDREAEERVRGGE